MKAQDGQKQGKSESQEKRRGTEGKEKRDDACRLKVIAKTGNVGIKKWGRPGRGGGAVQKSFTNGNVTASVPENGHSNR